MKYRRKPVVIDAIQWTGDNYPEIFELTYGNAYPSKLHSDTLAVTTLEGVEMATKGCYIIRDEHGGYHTCQEADFNKTYEPA